MMPPFEKPVTNTRARSIGYILAQPVDELADEADVVDTLRQGIATADAASIPRLANAVWVSHDESTGRSVLVQPGEGRHCHAILIKAVQRDDQRCCLLRA
jgi:hypothetical protein